MKQQFTGSYTLDVTGRTIVLSGIEIPQARLTVVINSTVGFVYHNIEHEPTAAVTISGGNTTIVFPRYKDKDCETHRNTDALSIFYDDGVDLGQLIKDESDETQALISSFRSEVKTESDQTQALLQTEFDAMQWSIPPGPWSPMGSVGILSEFQAEVKNELDATQTILQSGFTQAQTTLSEFKAEAKSESESTQTIFQTEFDQTQTILSDFKAEAKFESGETQAILDGKLPALTGGLIPTEFLSLFEAPNDVDVSFVAGGYGPSQIIFSKGGTTLRTLNLAYGASEDSLGKLISISPA